MNISAKNWCAALVTSCFLVTAWYGTDQIFILTDNLILRTGGKVSSIPRNITGLEAEDPILVDYLREFEILKPSLLPYQLKHPEQLHFSQYSQSLYAEKEFLRGLKKGFFVEAGAFNGEDKSNTLYFERQRGWSGLLIEPDPEQFQKLVALNRKAYAIQAGLSFSPFAGKVNFEPALALGRINANATDGVRIKTYPLYSMLLALEIKQIDFFSLDIEGDEMKVLETFPWDKIKVRLLCVEINHIPEGPQAVVEFFKGIGYTFLGYRRIDAWFGHPKLLKETMYLARWLLKNKLRMMMPTLLLQ